MSRTRLLGCVFFVALANALVASNEARHVLVVSFDGLRPDALSPERAPTLTRLAAEGSATMRAQTVYPSLTLPSHTSMLTGVTIARHGITWNDFAPTRGPVKVATIFDLAHQAGLSTAFFAGKPKFHQLERPGTFDVFKIHASAARRVAAAAVSHVLRAKPRLMFVHFADIDSAGHSAGWMGPEQLEAVQDCDTALSRLLEAYDQAGIRANTAIIVSADHGGHGRSHGSADPVDMTIPWIAAGSGIRPRLALTAPVTTYDTAATALALLGLAVPADWDGKPVAEALMPALAPSPAVAPAAGGASGR